VANIGPISSNTALISKEHINKCYLPQNFIFLRQNLTTVSPSAVIERDLTISTVFNIPKIAWT